MPAIIIRQRWEKQPQYPLGIAGANRLTTGLVSTTLMSAGGLDMASPGRAVALQSNAKFVGSRNAVVLSPGGSSPSGMNLGTFDFGQIVPHTSNCSVALGVVPFATGATEYLFGDFNTAGDAQNIYIGQTSGDVWRFGQSALTVDGGTVVANKLTHIVCTDNRLSQAVRLYVDGVLVNTGVNGGGSRYWGTPTGKLRVGAPGEYTGGLFFRGTVQYCHIWNRELSDDEIETLYYNPWQIFASQVRRVYFAAPAAGGGVFIPIVGRGPGMALAGSGGLAG